MKKDERFEFIMTEAWANNRVLITDLSQRIGVSEITIRRDIQELINQDLLEKAPGGARYVDQTSKKIYVLQRKDEEVEEKLKIAKETAKLISNGMCIFIGAGSTPVYISHYLKDFKNLTVITNAIHVAMELVSHPGITIIMTGGILRPSELALHGYIVPQSIKGIHVDKVIISIRGISKEAGMTDDHIEDIPTLRSFLDLSDELIVAIDHTKIGQTSLAPLAPINKISTFITDSKADPEFLAYLSSQGIKTIVAK